MKIIDNTSGLLDEKVTVELTLKELTLITNAIGITSRPGRIDGLIRYHTEGSFSDEYFETLERAEADENDTHEMYSELRTYLTQRGVFREGD